MHFNELVTTLQRRHQLKSWVYGRLDLAAVLDFDKLNQRTG
jgi:hypothetical protein